jgi:hypothetical protein
VLVAEGFPDPLATQLATLMGAPATPLGVEIPIATPVESTPAAESSSPASSSPAPSTQEPSRLEQSAPVLSSPTTGELTAPLVRFFGACGMMKAGLRIEQTGLPHVY